MKLRHDPEADAIYIQFSEGSFAKGRSVRGNMSNAAIDYAADGRVLGVELLGVSKGVDLKGVPMAAEISELLARHGFKVRSAKRMNA